MKTILAYSGGLDTTVILTWLKEYFDADVVTFAADIGQEEELEGLSEKARATGAKNHYTVDLVEEFARDYIIPWCGQMPSTKGSIFSAPPSLGH